MTTSNSVSNVRKVEITEGELQELQRARAQEAKKRAYRAERNQRPEVKLKNAEYHEKRASRLRAYDAAYRWLLDGKHLSDELQGQLLREVPELAEYVEMYTTA